MWKLSTSEHFQKLISVFSLLSRYLSAASLNVFFLFNLDNSYSVLWCCLNGHQVIMRLKFNEFFMISFFYGSLSDNLYWLCLTVEGCCKVAGNTLDISVVDKTLEVTFCGRLKFEVCWRALNLEFLLHLWYWGSWQECFLSHILSLHQQSWIARWLGADKCDPRGQIGPEADFQWNTGL